MDAPQKDINASNVLTITTDGWQAYHRILAPEVERWVSKSGTQRLEPERPINRTNDKADRKTYYSGKNKTHTLKNNAPPKSILWQDTGFQGYAPEDVQIQQTKKKACKGELSDTEKQENQAIFEIRVEVEHQIGGIKQTTTLKFNGILRQQIGRLHRRRNKLGKDWQQTEGTARLAISSFNWIWQNTWTSTTPAQ